MTLDEQAFRMIWGPMADEMLRKHRVSEASRITAIEALRFMADHTTSQAQHERAKAALEAMEQAR